MAIRLKMPNDQQHKLKERNEEVVVIVLTTFD